MNRLFALSLAVLATAAHAQLEPPTRREWVGMRNLALSPNGQLLAFSFRGDIWVASSEGGRAYPITDHVELDDNPIWSPDGNWIAFSTNRNGNNDIYVVPSDGGESRRLTWFSGSDVPRDWSDDGKSILISGSRDDFFDHIYRLDVKTGRYESIFRDFQTPSLPQLSPDGKSVLYARMGFPNVRPRYQGSSAMQMWIYDIASGKRIQVRNNGFQHLWPRWNGAGTGMYCVTVTEKTPSSSPIGKSIGMNVDNVNRTPNVYEVDRGGNVKRLTNFVGAAGTRYLTVGGGWLAFERDGIVYRMKPGSQPEKVTIFGPTDEKLATEERLNLTNGADEMALSPKGDRVVFSVRSELWSVPVKKGKGPNADDAIQLTDYPGVDEAPLYHPDGKSVFFMSNREGGKRIYRLDVETKAVTPFTTADFDHYGLEISPDGRELWFWRAGAGGGLFRMSVNGGVPERLVEENFGGGFAVSPDGQFLAYSRRLYNSGFNPWENQTNLHVLNLRTKEDVNVTKLSSFHGDPAWSADGKYLYFVSNRDGEGIYVLPLQREEARPLELEIKYEKPKEAIKLDFDFQDVERRIRKVNDGSASNLRFDPTNGDLLFWRGGDIWRRSYDGEQVNAITAGAGVGGFEFNGDGNGLFFMRNGMPSILNLRERGNPITTVSFRADWTRDVRAERNAAFNEFWHLYNRNFYDPNFHGRDWPALRERYRPLLQSVGHRNEFATILNQLVGELESSHSEVGASPGGPPSASSAMPGFIIDSTYDGPGLRIKEVPFRAPGSFAKTKLEAGEYVLRINGQPVKADEALWRLLNDQGGRELTLLVNKTPSETGARTVKYRALGFEWRQIAYQNRIDARRKMVDQLSGGKIGYLHIAGMGGGNFAQFNREAWQFIQGKSAVIIDVRENGGGNIADQLLDILERRPQGRYVPRDGSEQRAPGTTWDLPTVVMHAESSLSNAEMFPSMMKARGLATLVGKPTPGYVIYTYGGRLVDGTSIRLPSTGVYRLDGSPMENLGQKPDIEVDWSPEQFFAGKDPQLEKAVEVLLRKARG